jgi:hypothetical protein
VANLAVNLRSRMGRNGLNSCNSRQRTVERCREQWKSAENSGKVQRTVEKCREQ